MSNKQAKPLIASLGFVPPPVKAAVSDKANLQPWSDIGDEQLRFVNYALTTAMDGATPQMMERFPNLKHIVSIGAGLDRFDFDVLKRQKIELHPTGHVMTGDTAEMAITLMFALLRNVVNNDRHVRSGAWEKARAQLSTRIIGKKVGIVGLGKIGKTIGHLLSSIGLIVAYTGPNSKADIAWEYIPDLEMLASSSDILVLSCTGGPSTHKIINTKILKSLGEDSYLINVSRGSVVDEDALILALQQNLIAGAAMDVFENEPTPDKRFFELGNVVLQPHAAVMTKENRKEIATEIVRLLDL